MASGLAAHSPYPKGTIEMQTPLFLAMGLDLRRFYPATIGVSCGSKTFAMKRPEHTFRDVKWSPEHHSEDFSFSRCRLICNDITVDGWIYYPHPETKIGHHHDASTLEVVAPYVAGIRYGVDVELEINPAEIAITGRDGGFSRRDTD